MQSIIQGEVDFPTALAGILPHQKKFIESASKFTAYIGGFGSGKTVAGCLAMILLGRQIPNGLFLVGRYHYPELVDSTRRTFLELFPQEWVADNGKGWVESSNRLRTTNGTEYLFRHLDIADSHKRSHIRSLNLSGFLIDEGVEVPESTFLELDSRLRRKHGPFGHYGRIVGNPAGRDWVYNRFFSPKRRVAWQRLHEGILAPTAENTHLADSYVSDKLSTWPKDWIDRYLNASFADFSNLVYKEWDYNLHTWDPGVKWSFFEGDYNPPAKWPTIVGVDIGGHDPWGIVFIKVAPNGMLFQFDEIYERGILVKDIADRYWDIMSQQELEGLAYDYQNRQAAYELEEHQITGVPAIKEIQPGIFKVGQYLHPDPRLQNPFTGLFPSPRYFVSQKCEHTIREISSYSYEKEKSGASTGVPEDKDNHTCDAVRYAIHTFRPEPSKLITPPSYMTSNIDELSRLFWHDVAKHDKRLTERARRHRFGSGSKKQRPFQFKPIVMR